MIQGITINWHGDDVSVHVQTTDGHKVVEELSDETIQVIQVLRELLEAYKTPQERLQEEIIEEWVEGATDEEIVERQDVLKEWEPGQDYKQGQAVQYEGKPYRIVQAHVSQAYYPPSADTQALYTDITRTKELMEWVQPTGVHDAYMKGDRYVDEEGIVWEANSDHVVHSAKDFPPAWKRLGTREELGL